jgi:hypothetical protein
MLTFDWVAFLGKWSQEVLEETANSSTEWPSKVMATQWLGYAGATEEQITQAARLGTTLPPSYREFLKASNDWRATTPFIDRLWSIEEVEWFSTRHQNWISRHVEHYRRSARLDRNGHLERSTVPNESYYVYGEEQDCRNFRVEYLQTALEISDVSDSAIYLHSSL